MDHEEVIMPLTTKGKEIMEHMEKTYKSPEKAKEVFYASKNKGTITGVDSPCHMTRFFDAQRRGDAQAADKFIRDSQDHFASQQMGRPK